MKALKKVLQLLTISALAIIAAVNYAVFIFPNHFAPSGIDGICTMIQDVTKVSIGYLSLIVNIPLLIVAYIKLSRDFAVKSSVYILCFSLTSAFLNYIDISKFHYHTETNTSIVLAPIAAGTIRGILYYFTNRLDGSSGGVDIIAALIRKSKPYFNLMSVIFFLNIGVAVCSYFVYGFKIEPVICCILYSFITSYSSTHLQSSNKQTVKFEIITDDCETLCNKLLKELNQPATVIEAMGAYSGHNKKMVVCVTNKKTAPYLEELAHSFSDTVIFESVVNETIISGR